MKSKSVSTGDIARFRATLDGVEHDIACKSGQVLLDCMFDADLDPAFQCRKGHCGT